MSIVQEIVGGGVSQKKSGGKILTFPRPRNETMTRIIFGDRTLMSIREKISNWRTFVDVHWKKNGTLDKKSMEPLKDVLHELLDLDFQCNQDEVLQILEGIFKLPDADIINGIGKAHHLNEPIIISFRVNYMIWRDHLEELVMRFNETRTNYIKKHKLKDKPNDIPQLLENWRKYDRKYHIDSSSKLLLFSNLPANPSDIPNIKESKAKWNPGIERFDWTTGNKTKDLEEKLLKFQYLGFCPCEPVNRFVKLLEFPVKELLLAIKTLGGEKPKADYCDMLQNLKKVLIPPKFGENPPKLKISKIPHSSGLRKKYKMTSKTTYDVNNLAIRWYVDQYIELCKQTKSYFMAREKYYLGITTALNTMGFTVKKYVYRRHDI